MEKVGLSKKNSKFISMLSIKFTKVLKLKEPFDNKGKGEFVDFYV